MLTFVIVRHPLLRQHSYSQLPTMAPKKKRGRNKKPYEPYQSNKKMMNLLGFDSEDMFDQ